MSEIEKTKATCARLKWHLTRAKNMLAKELEAIKSPHVIENAFDEADMKLRVPVIFVTTQDIWFLPISSAGDCMVGAGKRNLLKI